MRYTSTLRVQLGRPLVKGAEGQQDPHDTQNGCTELQHPANMNVISLSLSPGRAVKTSDRFLTVILEICPQNDELSVRQVLPRDTRLGIKSPNSTAASLPDLKTKVSHSLSTAFSPGIRASHPPDLTAVTSSSLKSSSYASITNVNSPGLSTLLMPPNQASVLLAQPPSKVNSMPGATHGYSAIKETASLPGLTIGSTSGPASASSFSHKAVSIDLTDASTADLSPAISFSLQKATSYGLKVVSTQQDISGSTLSLKAASSPGLTKVSVTGPSNTTSASHKKATSPYLTVDCSTKCTVTSESGLTSSSSKRPKDATLNGFNHDSSSDSTSVKLSSFKNATSPGLSVGSSSRLTIGSSSDFTPGSSKRPKDAFLNGLSIDSSTGPTSAKSSSIHDTSPGLTAASKSGLISASSFRLKDASTHGSTDDTLPDLFSFHSSKTVSSPNLITSLSTDLRTDFSSNLTSAEPAKAQLNEDQLKSVLLESPEKKSNSLYLITEKCDTAAAHACETLSLRDKEGTQETDIIPISATLGSLERDTNQIGTALLSPESAPSSPIWEPISPKRKPAKTGDILRLVDTVFKVEVKVGSRAELCCGIRGTPPVAASWLRNKKQVMECPRISVHTCDTESRLLIDQVCEDDAGCYSLFVRDRTGSVQHQTTLAVVDHPSPPSGKPVISALQSSSLTLSWSGPCYDGGSAVLKYWVEVKCNSQQQGQDWQLVTNNCVNTSYHINEGLKPGGVYTFRVRAINVYGVSEAGEASDAVTMSVCADEEEPEAPVSHTHVTINTMEKLSDLYIQLEKLGVGKFGQVFKLQERSTGKMRAGKFFKTRTQKEREAARAEVELMNKLNHPKLVQCLAAHQEPGRLVLVLEYVAGGELFERIVADDFDHTEITCAQYMSQMLAGLEYMHQHSIVHLDLKPENIVCISKTSSQIKIIDFGLAKELDPRVPMKVLQGTAEFVAPEVIAFEPVWFTTDMWSLGVICYILVSGESPFQGSNDRETLQNITSGLWEFDEETDAILSKQAKDFIDRLLQKDKRSRLTANQALEHPWLKDQEATNMKALNKERMRRFVARQKWQRTGKALLALSRLSHLSSRTDTSEASPSQQILDGSDNHEVFSLLQQQLQVPPSFSSHLKDQVEVVGSSACFQCHIEGFPDPEVLWFFAGSPIQESRRFRIEYEDTGSCSLIISDVVPTDSGMYTCRASNAFGEVETSAKLTVHMLHAARWTKEGIQVAA